MNDELRRLARDRAGGRCEYCQLPDDALLQMNAERRIERRAELIRRGLF